MGGRDFNDLGRDLNRIIEDAVYRGNFGHLNDTISSTIGRAFGSSGFNDSYGNSDWNFNLSGARPMSKYEYDADFKEVSGGTWSKGKGSGTGAGTSAQHGYFAGRGKRRGGAIGMIAGGIVLLILSLIPLGIAAFGTLIELNAAGTVFYCISAVMAASGAILAVNGSNGMKRAGRFDRYVSYLNGRSYADIKELAQFAQKTESFIVRDIKKMLKKGWFLQGHLDKQEKCLMVSNEAYKQYMNALESAKQQAHEEKLRQENEGKRAELLTPEAKAVIDRGHEYIRQIRAANDAIPEEEVSDKIYRMELLVKKIFQQAEAYPESVPDLRKLMEYYLPMTIKLLDAYEELDKQPVQGENIISSQKEIERTLDTLNVAFEKLLDNLFRDKAWDVSADISVLKTMLAQEGLTDDGFPKK